MDLTRTAFEGLDEASRRHEKKIVVDFAADRFNHFIGVYLMILLAIFSKLGQVVGQKPICYEAHGDKVHDAAFYKYAESYCWYSERIVSNNISICDQLLEKGKLQDLNLPNNARDLKSMIQWLPYALLLEAFLLCFPTFYWNFRVGARLKAHIAFLQTLQKDIYEDVRKLPSGISFNRSFERSSEVSSMREPLRYSIMSRLCRENSATFDHHSYLSTVYKVLPSKERNTTSLKSTILRQWCDPDGNFGTEQNKILVRCYEMKQFISISSSFISLFVNLSAFCMVIYSGWGENIFRCDLPRYDDRCVICTLPSILESFSILIAASIASALYIAITLWILFTLNSTSNSRTGHFLDYASDKKSFALDAALHL